jgi:hypothetical protein
VQRHAQLVGIAPGGIDRLALCTIEGDNRIYLEVTHVAGQLVHPQKRRLPTLHREPRKWTVTIPVLGVNRKVN